MTRLNLICFDYGEKRIGVAIGQNLTATATPLETIALRRGRPDWQRISQLVRDWQPRALIVGNPLNMDGTVQPITHAADRFARQLAGRFGLPVYLADERLSTFEARLRLGSGAGIDAVAAQVILESWLATYRDAEAAGAAAMIPDRAGQG